MYKLLIVDDEFIERNALKFIVTNHCSSIGAMEEAANGREAITKAAIFKPDIILMDIKMPGINGIEAAKIIKSLHTEIKIIFLTAFDYFDYAQEAIHIGVEAFIVKPAPNEQVIETINNAIGALERERMQKARQQDAESKLELVTSYLESELVSSLVLGELDVDQIKEYLSVMSIEFSWGGGVLAQINHDIRLVASNSKLQKNMVKKRCTEKLKDYLGNSGILCVASGINDYIYLLCIGNNEDGELLEVSRFEELFKGAYSYIWEHVGVKIEIGIGTVVIKPEELFLSFSQARKAVKLATQSNPVRSYKQDENDVVVVDYPIEKEKLLCEKITLCDENAAFSVVDDILDSIIQSCSSQDEMRRKVYELLIIVSRSIQLETKLKHGDTGCYFRELQQRGYIGELRSYVKVEVSRLVSILTDLRMDKAETQVDRVCEYINHNYMRDIRLEEVADMMGISTFYFSKIFKHYQNVNFIDYVTRIRINKAKELLRDPAVNIKEISGMVGYSDPNYFARVFKRQENMTPTEYRNKKVLQ